MVSEAITIIWTCVATSAASSHDTDFIRCCMYSTCRRFPHLLLPASSRPLGDAADSADTGTGGYGVRIVPLVDAMQMPVAVVGWMENRVVGSQEHVRTPCRAVYRSH